MWIPIVLALCVLFAIVLAAFIVPEMRRRRIKARQRVIDGIIDDRNYEVGVILSFALYSVLRKPRHDKVV